MNGETKALNFAEYPRIPTPAELASLCGIKVERARQLLRGATPTNEEAKEIPTALEAWQDAHERDETPWVWEE